MGYPEKLFCVIYEKQEGKSSRIKNFKITDDVSDIIFAINNPQENCLIKAFPSWYEAEDFLKEKMDFEDKFVFDIADGQPIIINQYYAKNLE